MNRMNIICLGVRDMERAIRFYKDGLGFATSETSYDPPVIFFSTAGGTKLELFPIQQLAQDIDSANPPAIGTGFGGFTLAYNTKSRAGVEEVVALARKAGAQIVKEPQEVFWGGYHAYFRDPDGYYWEVAYGPDFIFDEQDMLVL